MNIDIKIGQLDLVASGTFLANANDSISLILKDDKEPLNLVIKFDSDDQDPRKGRVTTNVIDHQKLEITFINYDSHLGSYSQSPWLIGSAYNRQLYFSYMIYGFSETKMKKVEYFFYLGKVVDG